MKTIQPANADRNNPWLWIVWNDLDDRDTGKFFWFRTRALADGFLRFARKKGDVHLRGPAKIVICKGEAKSSSRAV